MVSKNVTIITRSSIYTMIIIDYGAWWVGYSVAGSGSVSGSMYALGNGDLPPTTGWYYYSGGWNNNDPSLMAITVLPFFENGRSQVRAGIEVEVNNIGPMDIGNGTLPRYPY